MIRVPHPALRGLYLQAASAATLMARLGDADSVLDRLTALDVSPLLADEVLAPLLMNSTMDNTLAAELARMTHAELGEAESYSAPVLPRMQSTPMNVMPALKPAPTPAEMQRLAGQHGSAMPFNPAERAARLRTNPDVAVIGESMTVVAPRQPTPPPHTGIRRVDTGEAHARLLAAAQRAGVSETVQQALVRAEDIVRATVDVSPQHAAQAASGSAPDLSPVQRRLDRAVNRISGLPSTAAAGRDIAVRYATEAPGVARPRPIQALSGNAASEPDAFIAAPARSMATADFAARTITGEQTPRMQPVSGLRRVAALASPAATAAPVLQPDTHAPSPAAPAAAAAATMDIETFEAQLLLSLQRAARRDGIDPKGIAP